MDVNNKKLAEQSGAEFVQAKPPETAEQIGQFCDSGPDHKPALASGEQVKKKSRQNVLGKTEAAGRADWSLRRKQPRVLDLSQLTNWIYFDLIPV